MIPVPVPIPVPRVDTEKKPDHVVEGVLQGMNKWCDHVGDGAHKLWRKSTEGHQREGALGAAKGVGGGLLDLANGVGKGTCDFLGSTLEGVRHTPDLVADKVIKERKHNKHGVEGEGRGELLESYLEEEREPEHLGQGLLSGARGLGRGLSSGWKDLVTKPRQGAQEAGAVGFAKGAGQGLLGFGTKAASGTLDLATSVLSGAKNTPDAIGKAVKDLRERSDAGTNAPPLFGSSTRPRGPKPDVPFSGDGRVLGTGEPEPDSQQATNSPATASTPSAAPPLPTEEDTAEATNSPAASSAPSAAPPLPTEEASPAEQTAAAQASPVETAPTVATAADVETSAAAAGDSPSTEAGATPEEASSAAGEVKHNAR